MILTTQQSITIILTIAIVTFLIRIIPFIMFPANKKTPKYIIYLGGVLPYAIIAMLVVYSLKKVSLISFPFGVPEFISIMCIILVHLWKNNTLLSIGGGTIFYMLLVQFFFN